MFFVPAYVILIRINRLIFAIRCSLVHPTWVAKTLALDSMCKLLSQILFFFFYFLLICLMFQQHGKCF